MAKNNARLPNIKPLIQAGIDPKTGLPMKLGANDHSELKNNIKRLVTVIDEQDALNRFTWYNLPDGLDGKLLERILYYKGQGMFFYMEANDRFYFLPYALDGTIDVYGRYTSVTPLPFGGSASTDSDGKQKPWIQGLSRKPIEEVLLPEDIDWNTWTDSCVLLHDYSKGLSETITPRSTLNRALIDVESEMIPFMRTGLLAATGISAMRVTSEDEQSNVKAASAAAEESALNGERWIPVVGQVDFQDLATGQVADASQFMMAMNSLDNLRLQTYGLDNGGLFEKQGTILQDEANAGGLNAGLILNDGITLRQEFCNRVNSVFGLGIWCEVTQPQMLQPDMSQEGSMVQPGEGEEATPAQDDGGAKDEQ